MTPLDLSIRSYAEDNGPDSHSFEIGRAHV